MSSVVDLHLATLTTLCTMSQHCITHESNPPYVICVFVHFVSYERDPN